MLNDINYLTHSTEMAIAARTTEKYANGIINFRLCYYSPLMANIPRNHSQVMYDDGYAFCTPAYIKVHLLFTITEFLSTLERIAESIYTN